MDHLDRGLSLVALRWMLLAQVLCLSLHVTRMPLLLLGLLAVCVVWRFQVIRGRARFPSASIKVMLATSGLIILFISFSKVSVNAAVNFLLLAFGLKLIELHTKRDAYISLFLSFLVVAVAFLFENSLWLACLVLLVCVVITCALIAMHSLTTPKVFSVLRQSLFYWLSAIPLMVIFFVFFPRMSPLWSMDLGQTAKTGLSDRMSPGDIAQLAQSDELVFRAHFPEGLNRQPEHLYWRAFVLDYSDGRGWERRELVDYAGPKVDWYQNTSSLWQSLRETKGPYFPYDVIMEPSHQPWLFSLAGAAPEQKNVGLTQDFMLQYDKPVRQTLRYSAKLASDVIHEPSLAQWRSGRELQLPDNENPKTKALARKLWDRTGSVPMFIEEALNFYRTNNFSYTLRPPQLGQKANDQFLFETRQGFCAHYAGGLALLARYAGVPARVVVGYLGGEWNASGQYLTVRQYDAHAWTEIWIPSQGWQRVDPTSVIAPDRIDRGLAEAVRDEGSFMEDSLLSPHKYKGIAMLDSVRIWMNEVNYQWSLRVVGYDLNKQSGMFAGLMNYWGRYTWLIIAMSLILTMMLPAVFFLLSRLTFFRRRVTTSKEAFDLVLFKAIFGKTNYHDKDSLMLPEGMTPRRLFDRLKQKYPDEYDQINWLSDRYESLSYGDLANNSSVDLDQHWRFLHKQLKQLIIKSEH